MSRRNPLLWLFPGWFATSTMSSRHLRREAFELLATRNRVRPLCDGVLDERNREYDVWLANLLAGVRKSSESAAALDRVATEHKDRQVRQTALRALGSHAEPDSADHQRTLLRAFLDRDDGARDAAGAALRSLYSSLPAHPLSVLECSTHTGRKGMWANAGLLAKTTSPLAPTVLSDFLDYELGTLYGLRDALRLLLPDSLEHGEVRKVVVGALLQYLDSALERARHSNCVNAEESKKLVKALSCVPGVDLVRRVQRLEEIQALPEEERSPHYQGGDGWDSSQAAHLEDHPEQAF